MSDRVREVVPDVLAAIHEVLERHRVTEEEWFGALAFLGEVAKADELVQVPGIGPGRASSIERTLQARRGSAS